MSSGARVIVVLLILLSACGAHAQQRPAQLSAWSLVVTDGRLSADIETIPLRLVLEELARQSPLHFSLNESGGNHLVTAHFRGRPLHEALARLLTGVRYALVMAEATASTNGLRAKAQTIELMVLGKTQAPAAPQNAGLVSIGQQGAPIGASLDLPPEWQAALNHGDRQVRLHALQRWAEHGAATSLNPLTQALTDPDELVRARAQVLLDRVWVGAETQGTSR